jgi:protein KTI12
MVRWDAPLFTVLWNDKEVPGIQIWEAITQGSLKPPNSGTLAVAKAPADALNILEKTTTAIVSTIVSNSSHSNGGSIPIFISQNVKQCITLPPRNITLSELQRLKRQFVIVHKKVITLGSIERGTIDWEEESIAKKFVEFIEEHLKS